MAVLSITAANVVQGADAQPAEGTAGATVTAGQTVYEDATDSKKLKLASATTLAKAAVKGVALHGASNNQPLKYQKKGNITIGATVTVGQTYGQAATDGAICPVADLVSTEFVTILGVGVSASQLKLIDPLVSGVQKP